MQYKLYFQLYNVFAFGIYIAGYGNNSYGSWIPYSCSRRPFSHSCFYCVRFRLIVTFPKELNLQRDGSEPKYFKSIGFSFCCDFFLPASTNT